MTPPRPLDPRVLLALGLGVGCRHVGDVSRPAVEAEDTDGDTDTAGPDTDTDAAPIDPGQLGPCLNFVLPPNTVEPVELFEADPPLEPAEPGEVPPVMNVCLMYIIEYDVVPYVPPPVEAPPTLEEPPVDEPADEEARRRVLDGGVLPADVAAILRKRA